MSDAQVIYLPRFDIPTRAGLYTVEGRDIDTFADMYLRTPEGAWLRGGIGQIPIAELPTNLARLGDHN